MFPRDARIETYDPELAQAIANEARRQEDHVELIASENYASPRVLEAQGSVLTNFDLIDGLRDFVGSAAAIGPNGASFGSGNILLGGGGSDIIDASDFSADVQIDLIDGYIGQRFGTAAPARPMLPVIPLGVHCQDFARNGAARASLRAQLGAAETDVVFVTIARLNPHEKFDPLPIFIAMQAAVADGAALIEELLPFTDWVPSATLGWVKEFGPDIVAQGKRTMGGGADFCVRGRIHWPVHSVSPHTST